MNQIQMLNYWEHVKSEKDFARVLPPDHPLRKKLHEAAQKIISEPNVQECDATEAK
jgi:hypothetical protein